MSTIPEERLKLAREKAGYANAVDAAAALGVNRNTYIQHENGTRGFPKDRAVQYARKFKVPVEWLLTGKGEPQAVKREALIVGYIGAGAEVIRFEEGVVLEGVELPPGVEEANAARIRGDSQYPLQDGWLVFYGPEYRGVPEDCIGKLSVVQVKDGPTLLKTLKRGNRKGRFRLESWNAPPREDQQIVWAARVLYVRTT